MCKNSLACQNSLINNCSLEDIMSDKLVTLHPKDTISRAKEVFKRYNIHHIPIVIMDELVGIISQGDVLTVNSKIHKVISEFKNYYQLESDTIDQFMTTNPICIEKEKTVLDALDLMMDNRINALPIVENNKLVGLITSFDLLKFLKLNLVK